MASTASGIEYPVAGDFIAPLNAHLQTLAETTQTALDNRIPETSTSYNPTFSGITIGNGTSSFQYVKSGSIVMVTGSITRGSTTTFGSTSDFSLPIAMSSATNTLSPLGIATYEDTGSAIYKGWVLRINNTTVRFVADSVSGSRIINSELTDTSPFAWGVGDKLHFQITYRTA
jgi:hypothetical protein